MTVAKRLEVDQPEALAGTDCVGVFRVVDEARVPHRCMKPLVQNTVGEIGPAARWPVPPSRSAAARIGSVDTAGLGHLVPTTSNTTVFDLVPIAAAKSDIDSGTPSWPSWIKRKSVSRVNVEVAGVVGAVYHDRLVEGLDGAVLF